MGFLLSLAADEGLGRALTSPDAPSRRPVGRWAQAARESRSQFNQRTGACQSAGGKPFRLWAFGFGLASVCGTLESLGPRDRGPWSGRLSATRSREDAVVRAVRHPDRMAEQEKRVLVTVGTTSFDALIRAVDDAGFVDVLKRRGYTSMSIQVRSICAQQPHRERG